MTMSPSFRLRAALLAVLLMGAFGAYWGWLGWDQEYQRDPLNGQASGPYEAWQVIGCALTLAGLALGAGALLCRGLALAVLPAAFTVAWSVPAAHVDDTGLWGVGAFMILLGALVGSAVLAVGGEGLRKRLDGRTLT